VLPGSRTLGNAPDSSEPRSQISFAPRSSAFGLVLAVATFLFALTGLAEPPKNPFANAGFEFGREGWRADKAGKTECQFSLDERDAAEGRRSALLTVGTVQDWGVQFGQSFSAGEKGKIYTFAAFAKSMRGPVEVGLQIERSARPWDRAVGSRFKLTEQWRELHVTFKVEKEFPEGWFAYLSCAQPNAQFKADVFRLYEGPYEPYEAIARQENAAVAVHLFDTGKPSRTPLTGEAIASRAGWTELEEDDAAHAFKGNAVFMNDRIAVALRRGAAGAEVYSLGPGAPVLRAVLAPAAGTDTPTLSSCKVVENNPGVASADAVFNADGKKLTLRYELDLGRPIVQTEVRGEVTSLRVEAPCRFVVMPDFFADDIVINAAELPVSKAELPSDNFLIHLLPDHQAIVMSVVKTGEEDAAVTLSGEGGNRRINGSEHRFGKDGKVWVAILSGPGIWDEERIAPEQAGQIMRLDWRTPFPAEWRVDWRRAEDVTDSWAMLDERPDGSFTKNSVFGGPDTIPSDRQRWTTVLGMFKYPCWIDRSGQAFLQPLKSRALSFDGPAIIYPVNRVRETRLDTFTVLDVVRNTLGVGPCEYILDVEQQQSQYKGRATCSVRDTLNPIYARGQQLQRKAEIEKVLQDLMIFIRHIRGRIENYVAFGRETLAYLAEQKKAHPELTEPLGELETLARRIDAIYAARKEYTAIPQESGKNGWKLDENLPHGRS